MLDMETTDQEIEAYIHNALQDQLFWKCEIALTGSNDGYASHITFATVGVITEECAEKDIELVVKSSRKNLIQTNPRLYGRETYFYETILPKFTSFQMQNNVKNIFNSVPLCYKAVSDDSMEVIVMENLRKSGYDLYDRKKPFDLNHLKLVLQEYGKFHAISFALRNKSKDDFEKLVANFDEVMIHYFIDSFRTTMHHCMKKACDIVKEVGDGKLYQTCRKILQKGADVAMIEIMETKESESAILHGHGWNNNFLFQYEDSKVPSRVAVIDWQLARLHSPVLDLSHVIYSTCSENELKHFDELLETYYTSFSAFLIDLGCDPDNLFSYSALQRHWKKYSLFGVLMLITYLHLSLCEDEDIPDFDECRHQSDFAEKLMNIKVKDESQYRQRIVSVINHYCNYQCP